jgi:plasmid stabilization system protein, relE/parE family
MKVFWADTATYELEQTLSYWTIHNMSTTYSDKIHAEVVKAINDIKNNPDFSGRYITELRAYQKIILKGKFSLYYEIEEVDGEKIIHIIRFRSNKQKPLY